jgi:outer membrane protein OmpA-like peptidoglycan-associated protein
MGQSAPIIVSVTDFNNSPLTGEQIHFVNSETKKIHSGVSNSKGIFNLSLPGGFKYEIKIKSVGDAAEYSTFEIPAIGSDQMYGENTVQIMIEQPKIFTLKNVLFETSKSNLKPSSYSELDELVSLLKYKPEMRIEIAGHTDNVGSSESNLTLSNARAKAVYSYLIKKGVSKGRLQANGYGDKQPVTSNDTAENRKLNRRTEIRVL